MWGRKAFFVSPSRELHFHCLRRLISAAEPGEVMPALAEVEAGVGDGLYAAGYIAYEAAAALNPSLLTHVGEDGFPLVWFGLYERCKEIPPCASSPGSYEVGPWTPEISKNEYETAVARIRAYFAAGDAYQVNYTFGATAPFWGNAEAWFRALCHAQQAQYAAFLDIGRFQIVSASPELFLRLTPEYLETRPMKGTRPRGIDIAQDAEFKNELAASVKDQAENLMIVDLLRNDLGRVSHMGSVEVCDLFQVEAYPTLWQMTSTIRSRTDATISKILQALFPCGSVTGAPKRRAMQIIHELEQRSRGVYCGTIGWQMPGRCAEFSVAIRTATIDRQHNLARYCVGSGIMWDSTPQAEYEECLVKAAVLDRSGSDFELIEALLFDGSYFLLDKHLARLADSAAFFGFCADMTAIRDGFMRAAASIPNGPRKVRLLLSRTGTFRIEHAPAEPIERLRVALAKTPVDERDIFLRHKTTRRTVYEHAMAVQPGVDDVLLWNRQGEITETCRGNIVAELEGRLVTPHIRCGLLPGTMRAELLEQGHITEGTLTREDLLNACAVYMINSVRKWVKLKLAG